VILINFSHPLTGQQLAQIQSLTGRPVEETRGEMPQFDHQTGFVEQIRALVDRVGLSTTQWQTLAILVNPPGYALATAVLMAELHGRMGHFPPVLRLRPVEDSPLAEFEVAEILNLQAIRESARKTRQAV
jgi:hypothetical protein